MTAEQAIDLAEHMAQDMGRPYAIVCMDDGSLRVWPLWRVGTRTPLETVKPSSNRYLTERVG